MGHYTRNGVDCFSPDDTEKSFYIPYDSSLSEIIEQVKVKFGDKIDFEDVTITPEYIHVMALGYDLYDSSDYENYLRISIE